MLLSRPLDPGAGGLTGVCREAATRLGPGREVWWSWVVGEGTKAGLREP